MMNNEKIAQELVAMARELTAADRILDDRDVIKALNALRKMQRELGDLFRSFKDVKRTEIENMGTVAKNMFKHIEKQLVDVLETTEGLIIHLVEETSDED